MREINANNTRKRRASIHLSQNSNSTTTFINNPKFQNHLQRRASISGPVSKGRRLSLSDIYHGHDQIDINSFHHNSSEALYNSIELESVALPNRNRRASFTRTDGNETLLHESLLFESLGI